MKSSSSTTLIVIVVLLLLLFCCICIIVIGFGFGFFSIFSSSVESSSSPLWNVSPTHTPLVIRPTPLSSGSGEGGGLATFIVPADTLNTLKNTYVPNNDLPDLARRLQGKNNVPETVDPPSGPFVEGAREDFWVTNVDTNESSRISATLQYVTDHAYFWIEDGIRFNMDELSALAETFENQIYPINREFFGSEWTPGVDGDPHLYILYAKGLGYSLAGYFSSADEYHPLAHEYSNAHEMFLLNSDNLGLSEDYTYGVLAHEFQHMIHWYRDRNETSWLNEGFSELAVFLNGYDAGGFDWLYTQNPDLQVNDWPNDQNATSPHYGAAFLFVNYFLDRFGDTATKALVAHPENGLDSMDAVLDELNMEDALTGRPIRGDDVFMDWVLATYLLDDSIADGRYTYHNYPEVPQADTTDTIRDCNKFETTSDVSQYGVDYLSFKCQGDHLIQFEGSMQVGLLPEDPYSGEYALWSNKGDESNMTLTRAFDFTDYVGPLTLTYWTWFDIESDYDYLYLEASLDGENWQILTTPSGTDDDPSGNSYGWAYNGTSPGWIEESVDISEYAGHEIFLRFEYVTDAAVNGEGFLLDDVAIQEIGYFTDFENNNDGWESAGWVRIQNILPQTFRLAVISFGDLTQIEYITLGEDNFVEIPIQIGDEVDEVVLAVTGTTRYTRQKAPYRIELIPIN